mmetsp:Transcript_25858/g.39120  ORF Transcript_25858/g.39120 Transcript_25858/m.39120 type:complete len:364 (-) Transcript_25858:257-1348(-)|eukprot:CAMPEP_0178920632 /NCGR_PEP_ID=MMETSP0786-20121207/15109_1 /TAXON_ID=186022 /ORGANISM="Thalassionema frauenfeldii, Strain CCMP 1798" /LENGTH=363 /DNA_ID=CAMNT_0020594713 /DNA_START=74 /DNA_END=1165 /DNA_ORIENTATION=-
MSSDFRSLLTTFESATGSKNKVDLKQRPKKEMSLKELTNKLWRWSQIRQSTTKLRAGSPGRKSTEEPRPVHLAVCLCIVDKLTHENVWKDWIEQRNSQISAELYVHAKLPSSVTGAWTKSKLINVSHCPNWNDVRIVRAMLSLIEEALKDGKTTHVVFGTESCLPICPLDQVTDLRFGKSYLAYYGKSDATRFDERDVWDVLRVNMPLDCIHKALPGWCTLARDHAQEIIEMPSKHLEGKEFWNAFSHCWAPEEAFFPTALALLGLLHETECRSLTYAEWCEHKTSSDRAHPRAWDEDFDSKLVSSLRDTHKCIILRKVKNPIKLDKWRKITSAVVSSKRQSIATIETPDLKKSRPNLKNFPL